MGLFNIWNELIITQDRNKFDSACAVLTNFGIAYKEKSQHIGYSNRRSGAIGSLGENTDYSYLYQIFVHRKDLDMARSLIFHNNT